MKKGPACRVLFQFLSATDQGSLGVRTGCLNKLAGPPDASLREAMKLRSRRPLITHAPDVHGGCQRRVAVRCMLTHLVCAHCPNTRQCHSPTTLLYAKLLRGRHWCGADAIDSLPHCSHEGSDVWQLEDNSSNL